MYKIIALMLLALIAGCSKPNESKIPLTEKELAYISSHPNVSWAAEGNRPPYIFIENGEIIGLAPEYLELISKKTGLKFRPIKTGGFNSSIEALRKGAVDIVTTIRPTPENAEFMGFTPPFAYQGGVFVFRMNTLPRSPLTTGILNNSAAKKYLQTRFPDMNLIETEDDEQSILLLQKGLVDGAVTDNGSAIYLGKKSSVITRSASINFDYPYSFAYRRDDQVLGAIMTKAIASITPTEKSMINKKWLIEEK